MPKPTFPLMPRGSGTASPGGFNMLRWFALLTLVCVSIFGIGTASYLGNFLTRQMLEREAELSAEFLDSIIAAERTWSYFADPSSAESRAPLESFFNHVSRLPGVVRANVFGTDGTMLWSSNPAMIGRRFSGNHELEEALRGRIAIESGTAGKDEHERLEETVGERRFIETYLPVRDEAGRNVIGVVEIYRLPDALFRAIDKGVRLVWTAAFLGAVLLYAALFWIALRASRIIARQQRMLMEAEALSAIGAVASAVAHGIRNPLASIRSSAELAAMEDAAGNAACLADIQREADRLDGWVRDLLLQARGEPIAASSVDVTVLLEQCAQGAAARAARQGIAITLRTAPVPPVRAETAALGQAIDNLVANAIEAMPDGGALTLVASLAADGAEVEISIQDTGAGLPAESAASGLFFSTKARGTGLGLLLTRRILERHAGRLMLSRGQRGGTSAVIRLPAAA